MLIETADFFIHLDRLGLLIVIFAAWRLVPELLPPGKKGLWRAVATENFGTVTTLILSLLFVCFVFYYTVILFFASTFLLQSITFYFGMPGRLNFMVIILAIPIASVLQMYTIKTMGKAGLLSVGLPGHDGEQNISTIRAGTLLFSTGVFLQFLATFG